MAAGNETKVDTALLANTAESLSPLIKNLENIFEQFQQEVKSSRSEWQGDASDDIRNTAAQLKSSSSEIVKVLNGYFSFSSNCDSSSVFKLYSAVATASSIRPSTSRLAEFH